MLHLRMALAVLGVGAAAALAAAGSGKAGGIGGSGLWVCGPHRAARLTGAIEQEVPVQYKAGLRPAAPAPPQAFYRVDLNGSTTCASLAVGQPEYFIPATGEVRIVGPSDNAFWVKLAPDVTAKLRKATREVKPYRAPTQLLSVSVNDNDATRPSSYLRLYTIGTHIRRMPSGIHWLRIILFGDSSPWTDGRNLLEVSRRGHDYLKRDGQVLRIAASVASRIRHAQSIPK